MEFTRDGLIVEHKQPQSATYLGLHPRDVSLFISDNRLTPQRATIAVRDGAILFRTEAARALIGADKVGCTMNGPLHTLHTLQGHTRT